MTKPFRVGVAGLGFGAAIHVPGFRRLPDVEVAGICGRDLARTTKIAESLGVANAFTSIEQLLDSGIDAVSLALPPAHNTRGAALAIERGIPVLCEKPLAIDPTTARR